jgi:pentatricopeptide repeat protein
VCAYDPLTHVQVTYTALFKGLCSANRLDDAMTMLSEMQDSGLRPNDRTFSTLMRGCMRDARGDAAQAVLVHMQSTGIALDGACLEYAIKALVYDGELKAASKLCKANARNVTAAAAVALATGWAIAGKGKKAGKAAALAKDKLAPGSDAKLNPFKKADAGNSHEMYSIHQANELQVAPRETSNSTPIIITLNPL